MWVEGNRLLCKLPRTVLQLRYFIDSIKCYAGVAKNFNTGTKMAVRCQFGRAICLRKAIIILIWAMPLAWVGLFLQTMLTRILNFVIIMGFALKS